MRKKSGHNVPNNKIRRLIDIMDKSNENIDKPFLSLMIKVLKWYHKLTNSSCAESGILGAIIMIGYAYLISSIPVLIATFTLPNFNDNAILDWYSWCLGIEVTIYLIFYYTMFFLYDSIAAGKIKVSTEDYDTLGIKIYSQTEV